MKEISGFSKLTKNQKIDWIKEHYFNNSQEAENLIKSYWHTDEAMQTLHDEFIENAITNFYLPFGLAPNFLIDNQFYTIPMVIEESSVVAAASKAAKFWSSRGGFKTEILGTEKIGQVHFIFKGNFQKLETFFNEIKPLFYSETQSITTNMQKRGGGIKNIELRNKTKDLADYFQLHITFETVDSMGANFINSCLEQMAQVLKREAQNHAAFDEKEKQLQVVMSILSNYVNNCIVRTSVSCPIEDLKTKDVENPFEYAEKFVTAVNIAKIEPYRAVTHNKGIMNGIDAVVLATGNDFRAVEAGAHAYASRDGQYRSLSKAEIKNNVFTFSMDIPLALGTVGGLTSLHPMVKIALQILKNPSAKRLMSIVASAGLAQNFAALNSLTTKGIQEGHMKMHLNNILNQYQATNNERIEVQNYFANNTITHASVSEFIKSLRA
jgi:hydroxymethylglutaryl-CoA reductase